MQIEEVMAWKRGNIMFNKMTLLAIIEELQRWYDIDENYDHIPSSHYHSFISK